MLLREIPKRSGGIRRIYAPNDAEKEQLRALLPDLNRLQTTLSAAHGFRPERNVITAALPHIGMEVTVNLDLRDFFDHCTLDKARTRNVPGTVLATPKAFIGADGMVSNQTVSWPDSLPNYKPDAERAARQGLPTSPAIANLCAKPLDDAVIKLLKKQGHAGLCLNGKPATSDTAAYTRYADDLSISFKHDPGQKVIASVIAKVKEAAQRCGFLVHPRKIRVQRAAGGRREVVGVRVDSEGVYPSRRHRRELRAAWHNASVQCLNEKQRHRLLGLSEWCKAKPPLTTAERSRRLELQAERDTAKAYAEANEQARRTGLAALDPEWAKHKVFKPQALPNGVRITVDPREFLNMGRVRYAGGGSSCLYPGGGYYRGVVFWAAYPGIGLAVIDGKDEYRARVVVYALRNGTKVYGRPYGFRHDDQTLLCRTLRQAGFVPAGELPHCETDDHAVIGTAPRYLTVAYLDYGRTINVTVHGEERRKLTLAAF